MRIRETLEPLKRDAAADIGRDALPGAIRKRSCALEEILLAVTASATQPHRGWKYGIRHAR